MAHTTVPLLHATELARRVADRFRQSGGSGSRIPLATREEIVEDSGLRCIVRVLADRERDGGETGEDGAQAAAREPGDVGAGGASCAAERRTGSSGLSSASPFLPPYDPTLLVGAISPTHVCLLNKYNVYDHHLLIVTRDSEDQESPLGVEDLDAARTCLGAIEGLVFYNAGAAAGASQPHKHLQLVPFPLGPGDERLPFASVLAAALAAGEDRAAVLPFRHRLVALPPHDDGRQAYRAYCELTRGFELERGRRMAPYNLLLTRDWMLLVPRSRSGCGSLEVNALGFAGAFLARAEKDLALVRELGPLEVLRRVAFPI